MDGLLATLRVVGRGGLHPREPEILRQRLQTAAARCMASHGAPRRAGIYALYLDPGADPVYVGKTQGQHGLAHRLDEHVATLRLHHGLSPEQVWCRWVVYARRAPLPYLEAALIRWYRPAWNEMVGFGSGRARKGLEPVGAWEQTFPRRATPAVAEGHAAYARESLDLD